MMKNRSLILATPSTLAAIILALVFLNQFSTKLPASAKDVQIAYLEQSYPSGVQVSLTFAQNRERLTAEQILAVNPLTPSNYVQSPVLYGGVIIQPPERKNRFPFPAQEVWCVNLDEKSEAADFLILAHHASLDDETWVLYQPESGSNISELIGCITEA